MTYQQHRSQRTLFPWVMAALVIALTGMVAMVVSETYRATSTMVVRPQAHVTDVDDAVDQLEGFDASDALGTLIQIVDSADIKQRAMDELGISTTAAQEFEVTVSNPSNTMAVTIEVVGPSTDVAALAGEIARQGTEVINESNGSLVLETLGSPAPVAVRGIGYATFVFVALVSFIATLTLVTNAMLSDQDRKEFPGTLKAVLHDWIEGRPVPGPRRRQWSVPGLVGAVVLLGVTASLITTSSLGLAAVVGVTTGLSLLFAVRFPQWLTIGLVLLVVVHLSDVGTDFFGLPGFSVPYAVFVLFVVTVRHIVIGEDRGGWLGLALGIAALVTVMSISGLGAGDQALAFETTIDVAKNGLVAVLMVVLIRQVADLRRVVWALILGASVLALLGILRAEIGQIPGVLEGFSQVVTDAVEDQVVGIRIAGPTGDANFFGQLLVMMFPFALERSFRERSWPLRLIAVVASLLIAWAVMLTYSRGALIGIIASSILFLVWLRPSLKTVMVGVGISALLLLSAPSTYVERIGTIGQVAQIGTQARPEDPSIQGRVSEMLVGLEMFRDHPIIGIGPGNYPGRYVEYSSALGLDYRLELRQPHSLPIEVAAELGLIGLTWWFIAAVMLGRGLFGARRVAISTRDIEMKNYLEVICVSLAGFAMTALFLHLAFARSFWMMVGIAVAAVRVTYLNPALRVATRDHERV